ncbi:MULTISPECIES: LysE family translocator [unclassified Ruegeria]|uniref:LysE family translocator n=1 Tax=unclassified Ruegeria TaxID=2625375 RepID=UPI001AD9D5C6|nr:MULTISPECIES: LysE family translocator [unclassified Ruegeria]MBO9413154.1 LysE family translocator [Ruegeria sp. R8_1]MBO9416862.1 LysE family translocator [Ruegeria sp. R8_2]
MIPVDVVILFMSVAIALAAVPGPDNIFVLTQSALYGRMSGLIVTLGLASGLIVHTTAAAFGVAVLFQTSQAAFAMLKYAGAGYLVYLAWKAFTATETRLDSADAPRIATRKLFLRGLIMNIANPKVTIFMLAFLPQFVDPNNGPIIGQFYQLGALMFLATVVVFGAVALAAGTLGGLLRGSPGVQMWLNRISGVIFVALALKLATAER